MIARPMAAAGSDDVATVAAVAITRDRPALLEGVLASFVSFLRPTDDAVVIDSASEDAASIAAIARRAGVRLQRLERPGASRARNAGLAATTAPIIAYTDDDCLITEGWTAGIEAALADPALGFVTGQIEADRSTRLPLSLSTEDVPRRFAGAQDPVLCGSSANVAFRRDALASVGGFDEMLGPGAPLGVAEDMDLFWRLLRAGWAGAYDPTLVVTHRQWRSDQQALMQNYRYGLGAGAFVAKAIRLERKEGWRLFRARFWRDGLRHSFTQLRQGYEAGAAADALRGVGVAVGAIRASRVPLSDGRYRERRPR
jgi:glycosyltransferase involved in cell wall biosynthesis